ncbi:MAG: 50S ribosomal protein L6 [Bacilli bacterium]|jgi:large subunit ribosomal protein L6|nr:50S ribosomal protein L6 [Bacilli bacterium]NLN80845.1 50S ribosomal protein L6 [Erysipelotrichia bacterium]
MSRIGKKEIKIPSGVNVEIKNDIAHVKGPKGTLEVKIPEHISLTISDEQISVTRDNELRTSRQNHGTFRSLLYNAVVGVSEGFRKTLEIVGKGYRANMRGADLVLHIGYAHDVVITPEEGVTISLKEKSTNVIYVDGISKQAVGQTAARIREVRKPEPYLGKGIKYAGEYIRRKEGKRAGVAK